MFNRGLGFIFAGIAALITALSLNSSAQAQSINQYWLAAQHDWSACRGFFFVIESPFAADHPSRMADAKVILGVGDGKEWKFLSGRLDWQPGQTYSARAVVNPGEAQLFIAGKQVAKQSVSFVPAASNELAYNDHPSFLSGPTEFDVRETKLVARSAGTEALSPKLEQSELPAQLAVLCPGAKASRAAFTVKAPVVIDVEFSFIKPKNIKELSPLIDKYGQPIAADWPGKVRSDDDLKKADETEAAKFAAWGAVQGFDQYGGVTSAGWKSDATGFYRVLKHDSRWWLITPEGNPCFYIGLCDAPAQEWEATPVTGREYLFEWLPPNKGEFDSALRVNPWFINEESQTRYLPWQAVNMIRKFGPDWRDRATGSAVRRLKALGFSGFGKWCASGAGVADMPVIRHDGVPNIAGHPDVFDSAVCEKFEAVLRQQIEPRKSDPWLLGWSVGNEMDECIKPDEITKILAMGDDVPAKRAMRQSMPDVASPPTAQQIEKLRQFYASHYYEFTYKTVKKIDPNHLYFGMWVTPNWWVNSADWACVAPHCDVIGFDFYAKQFDVEPMGQLLASNDKPVLCGEFATPPHYGGARGFGRYHNSCETEVESGDCYKKFVEGAAKNANCVGVMYFQYRDQPVTGRGPGASPDAAVIGEDFAFGIVDGTDRLKWDFVQRVREANLGAAKLRLGGQTP